MLVDVFINGVGWVQIANVADPHPGTWGCTFGDSIVWSSWPQAQQATSDLLTLRPTYSAEGGCDRLCRPGAAAHAAEADIAPAPAPLARGLVPPPAPAPVVDHTPGTLAAQLLPLVSCVSADELFEYLDAAIADQLTEAAKAKAEAATAPGGEEQLAGCKAAVAAGSISHGELLELCRERGGAGVLGQLFSHVSTLQLPLGVRATLDPHQDTEFVHVRKRPATAAAAAAAAGAEEEDPEEVGRRARADQALGLGGGVVAGGGRHPVVHTSLKSVQSVEPR